MSEQMKLSEAIRAGATLRPQGRGFFFSRGCSCALGAAAEALGVSYFGGETLAMRKLVQSYRYLSDKTPTSVWRGITHRNDDLGQTREQIADWLAEQGL